MALMRVILRSRIYSVGSLDETSAWAIPGTCEHLEDGTVRLTFSESSERETLVINQAVSKRLPLKTICELFSSWEIVSIDQRWSQNYVLRLTPVDPHWAFQLEIRCKEPEKPILNKEELSEVLSALLKRSSPGGG